MSEKRCIRCDKPLSGGLDTFGAIGLEMCWGCYAETCGCPEGIDSFYGLAPHHRDLSITGSLIGSTVLNPLPDPDNGEYDLGWATFVMDPEAPGCGTYFPKRPLGWR